MHVGAVVVFDADHCGASRGNRAETAWACVQRRLEGRPVDARRLPLVEAGQELATVPLTM
jgi:hypothetical protein